MLLHRLPILLLTIAPLSVQAQPDDIQKSFRSSDQALLVVDIQQHTPAKLNFSSFRSFGYWGAEGANPSFCVSSFRISRDKKRIGLSAKHFVDLCNVSQASFAEKDQNVILTLRGGDAAYSFTAEFVINGENIIERTVRDGEFPEVYEQTHFSLPLVVE